MLVLHGYLWWRLVRSTTRPGRARRRLTLLTVVLALLPAAAVLLRREDSAAATVLSWIGFSWLGIAFYAFLALLVLEPVRPLLRRASRRRPQPEPVRSVTPSVVPSGAPGAPRGEDAAAAPDGGTASAPARADDEGSVADPS